METTVQGRIVDEIVDDRAERQGLVDSRHGTAGKLVLAHICLSAGGLLFHLGQHPPWQSLFFWFAAPVSALSLFLLPPLFLKAGTVGFASLLNATAVGIGCIGMTYQAATSLGWPFSPAALLGEPAIPGVFILLARLPLAQVIVLQVRSKEQGRGRERGCRA